MGTRGVWGFRKNGHTIATYRQFDCYPEGLGKDFFEFVKKNNKQGRLWNLFDNIIEINEKDKPTEEQKEYCKKMGWFNDYVSSKSDDDWYCLLRGLQDPENWQTVIDDGGNVYVDNCINFLIRDSLFCEYGYIFDIDDNVLEFYVGFQNIPQMDNPYGCEPNKDGYYPCRLIGKLYMDDMARIEYVSSEDAVGWMKIQSIQYEKEL